MVTARAVAETVTQATITLDGRSTTVALPRDTPVLEGAQRARPDLPFACQGGGSARPTGRRPR